MNKSEPRAASLATTVLALLLLSLGPYAEPAHAASDLSGAPAPDFVLKSLSGENFRLSEYRGEVVMVSFWATWCGDCRAQLAELNEWYGTYRGAGLELLAVSLDRNIDDVSDTATTLKLEYPVLHDVNLEVSKLYDVGNMPAAVLIDRDGIVREVIEGYRRSRSQEFLDRVRDLLRE